MAPDNTIEAHTIPGLLKKRAEQDPEKVPYFYIRKGKWTPIIYAEYFEKCREAAMGFLAMGLEKGEAVSIWSNNRMEWFYADLGASLVGGVPVGVYQTNTAEQGAYVIDHSESKFAIVEGQEELDKILDQWDNMPRLELVFVIEHVEIEHPKIRKYSDLHEQGKKLYQENPELFEQRFKTIQPEDTASIVYTSGTTGPPKGVVLTHANCIYFLKHYFDSLPAASSDVTMAFMPLTHVGGRMGSHYVILYSGMTAILAESWEELFYNLSEARPTFIATTPRIIEKFHSMIMAAISDAPKIQQVLSGWCMKVGREASLVKQQYKSLAPPLWVKNQIADLILFRKIRKMFGGKICSFVSGGAPISKDLIEFFHGVGILILETYGQSETSGSVVQNRMDDYCFGSVGKVYPGSEIKLMEDGEILYRGPAATPGYLKAPEANKELFDEDGWLYTGDIGEFNEDGYLIITDRKKDIMITSAGKNVAPQNIENLLKTSKYISHACVIGDGRIYLTALITLDEDECPKYARDHKIIFKDLKDLTRKPEIIKLIDNVVKEKNEKLHRVEQIKYFRILEEELDQDEGEITPTMKIKRKNLYERNKDIVESMYKHS